MLIFQRILLTFLVVCIVWQRVEAQENEELVIVPEMPEDVVLVDQETEFHAPEDGEYNIVGKHAKEHAHHNSDNDGEYNIVGKHATDHHNSDSNEQQQDEEEEMTMGTQVHVAQISIPEVRVRTLGSDGTAIDTQRYFICQKN
jgi:hypothetical protein